MLGAADGYGQEMLAGCLRVELGVGAAACLGVAAVLDGVDAAAGAAGDLVDVRGDLPDLVATLLIEADCAKFAGVGGVLVVR